jgi:hypothetical protein
MRRARVGVGIDGNGLASHAPSRADHPARNLAAIGDQDFAKHQNLRSPFHQAKAASSTVIVRMSGGIVTTQ